MMLLAFQGGVAMKAEPIVIDVGRDFSTTPGGRYRNEGAWSGQEFRETFLEPRLKERQDVIVDLDGPVGFTTSFLEEVFGGIVRLFGPDVVKAHVRIRSAKRPTRAQKAQMYLERAITSYR